MLSDRDILRVAGSASYEKGKKYFEQGKVRKIQESEIFPGNYRVTVSGSREYTVHLNFSDNGKLDYYECDCPAAMSSYSPCKHVAAALFSLAGKIAEDVSVRQAGNDFFDLFNFPVSDGEPLRMEGEFYVQRSNEHSSLAWAEFSIGRSRQYILKDVYEFVGCGLNGDDFCFGKELTVKNGEYIFLSGKSQFFWELLKDVYYEAVTFNNGCRFSAERGSWRQFFDRKKVRLSPSRLKRILNYYEENGDKIELSLNDSPVKEMEILSGNPPLEITVSGEKNAGILVLQPEELVVLTDDYSYIVADGQIFHTDTDWQRSAAPIFKAFQNGNRLKLKKEQLGEFFARVLPELKKAARVKVAEELKQEYRMVPLQAEAYIDYFKEGVACRVIYHYGEQELNPCLKQPPVGGLIRDCLKEWRLEQLFERFGFRKEDGRYVQEDEDRAYEFFTEGVQQLGKLADVFYSELFKKSPVQRMPKITVGVSVNQGNLLEIKIAKSALDFDELVNLIGAYRQKRRYHRIKDGTFVTLGDRQLDELAELLENEAIRKNADGTLTVPLADALYVDELAKKSAVLELEPSREYRRLVRSITNPEMLNLPVPAEVNGVLRDYQVTGFNWLSTLAAYGLGGILADDMGLGKTLQVITFLLAHRADRPALVVAPTSLMYNWLEEIAKFAPSLRARAINGTKKEREKALSTAAEYDVVITTYNLLKRDIDLYRQETFSWCFIDEAQYIKNPSTKNAKAVKHLSVGGYFALTGTPIENTLTELWSIFDFLMPGYLGSHKNFKQKYEIPIVRAQDERIAGKLSRRIAPFVLRRLKKEVLTELPDKVETKFMAEMQEDQFKVYMAYFAQAQKEFAKELKAHGFESSRIKILALLTRLRQIACDPSLFLENYEGGSAKLDLLMDIVTQAILSGHRLLIFSQFVVMLHHIAARLEAAEIAYNYLDGQTPSEERLALVNGFNSGTAPVFLISLKAGGTGLNLTGADMVIHYDPWWNPAVEDQATDRAYRIGQEKNVQVIRLVTKDTIEEKIYDLQETKKALIDKMIKPGENFISQLSEEEIRGLFI